MSQSSSTYSTALAVAAGALLGAELTYATARPTQANKGDEWGRILEVNLVVDDEIKDSIASGWNLTAKNFWPCLALSTQAF